MSPNARNLDNAVTATPPAVPEASPFAIRGNTRTVAVWHLEKSPVEKKAQAQRQTALDDEESARARAELVERRALYHVSNAEWSDAEKKLRAFLGSRSRGGAAQDLISSWRDYVPSQPRNGNFVAEAQFSRRVPTQHDKCIMCEAVRTVLTDASLSEDEKEWQIRRLAHADPKRLISLPTGGPAAPGAQDKSTLDDSLSASAWGHLRASSVQRETVVRNESLFGNMIDKADLKESTLAARRSDYELCQATTKFLIEGTGLLNDNEIVDHLTNNKTLRQHPKSVLQRVAVYRANKEAAQSALVAANSDSRLSVADIEKASKAKADALELERDLVMLETKQKANKAGLELAEEGHSISKQNDVLRAFRRSPEAARYYHHQRGGRGHGEGRGRWCTNGKNDDEIEEEAEQELGGITSKHTCEHEDDTSVSTDDGPFTLEQALEAASGIAGAAGPSTEVQTALSSKSKKDFAVEPKQKKGKGLGKLSVNNGPLDRPRWMYVGLNSDACDH